jgi:hypothetical protein
MQNYYDYLKENYPTNAEDEAAEQNKNIIQDRISSFANAGAVGVKFKNTRDKMIKAVSLPKGAKEELNFPMEVQDKILKGLPLWDEDEGEEDDDKDKKRLTPE